MLQYTKDPHAVLQPISAVVWKLYGDTKRQNGNFGFSKTDTWLKKERLMCFLPEEIAFSGRSPAAAPLSN